MLLIWYCAINSAISVYPSASPDIYFWLLLVVFVLLIGYCANGEAISDYPFTTPYSIPCYWYIGFVLLIEYGAISGAISAYFLTHLLSSLVIGRVCPAYRVLCHKLSNICLFSAASAVILCYW